MATNSSNASPNAYGTTNFLPCQRALESPCSYETRTKRFVSIGKDHADAAVDITTNAMCAPGVLPHHMELSRVLALRKLHPLTPYNHREWELQLCKYDLLNEYPDLSEGLRSGFNLHIPIVLHTQSPPNSASLTIFRTAFDKILERELSTGRYIGPFSQDNLNALLGPFQSSPISIIPKAGKPGKFRVIQNFSFPANTSLAHPNISINSSVNSDDFPCTWGTFDTICTIIRSLPPGSQAATRDVAEAYRTIPLHHSQWAAAVVCLPDGDLCVDTCVSFGMGPSAGVYGHVADAGADLLRAAGIGPLAKWVDDHLFFRIRREHLLTYNEHRKNLHGLLEANGKSQSGGRLWYESGPLDDGSFDIHAENCKFPLRDLSDSSPRSDIDGDFTFAFEDITRLSRLLGIPWELTKDALFGFVALYLGFLWDISCLSVRLSPEKQAKYLLAIAEWRSHATHTLLDIQRLYGKLLHSCLVVPAGRAYLSGLETMLGVSHDSPFVPRHSSRHLNEELEWWEERLNRPFVGRPITQPSSLIDLRAFSDASTSFGIAITLNGYWRAWRLLPRWQTCGGQRDIGWAECVGFELLVHAILNGRQPNIHKHFRLFCDNQGVVNGWKNHRSRNRATNLVFRRIHSLLESIGGGTSFHLQYVPSADNPADDPSRGIFPPRRFLLPPIALPGDLCQFLVDVEPSTESDRPRVFDTQQSVDEVVDTENDGYWGEQLLQLRDFWQE